MLTANKKAITKNISILYMMERLIFSCRFKPHQLTGFGIDFILIGLLLQMFMNLWKKRKKKDKSKSELKGLLDVYLNF